jgi:hypothetical protein
MIGASFAPMRTVGCWLGGRGCGEINGWGGRGRGGAPDPNPLSIVQQVALSREMTIPSALTAAQAAAASALVRASLTLPANAAVSSASINDLTATLNLDGADDRRTRQRGGNRKHPGRSERAASARPHGGPRCFADITSLPFLRGFVASWLRPTTRSGT